MRTETTVHRVAKIEITDRRFHESDTNPFWAREIVITDEDGNTHTLALYSNSSDEETALRVSS
jgi:hypothetical protein